MTARRKRARPRPLEDTTPAKKNGDDIPVTTLPSNVGTSYGSATKTAPNNAIAAHPSLSLRNMEILVVHHDRQRGLSKARIAKRRNLSTNQVDWILKQDLSEIDIPSLEIDAHIRHTIARLRNFSDEVMNAVTHDEVKEASLMQKMTVVGITEDKALALDKHIRGTKDVREGGVVDLKTRKEIEARIAFLEQQFGIRRIKKVEAEVIEITSVEKDDEQIDLFAQGKPETSPRAKKSRVRGAQEVDKRVRQTQYK